MKINVHPTQMVLPMLHFVDFFNQYLINLGSYLLIIKIFSQYSIIMSDKKIIEDSPA